MHQSRAEDVGARARHLNHFRQLQGEGGRMRDLKRAVLIGTAALVLATSPLAAQEQEKPNILVIWGDDIGTWNISHNNRGMMGYQTPNIDRIADEGLSFTDYYGQQSCTAGRAAFIGG